MYISEIQKRLMNAIDVCGDYYGVFDLAVKNGANPKEMMDSYHLALWFEGAPKDVKLKMCVLLYDSGIYEPGIRVCSHCGRFMIDGYVICDYDAYACSRECAIAHYGTEKRLEEALDAEPDDNFWTEWYPEL